MLAAIPLPMVATIVAFVAVAGWVADQILTDVTKIRRDRLHRRH